MKNTLKMEYEKVQDNLVKVSFVVHEQDFEEALEVLKNLNKSNRKQQPKSQLLFDECM